MFEEEALEDVTAFLLADPRRNCTAVIEGGKLQEIHSSPGRASLGIGGTEDYAGQPAMDNGPGTHGTRFFGNVERAVGQTPIADGFLSHGQGQHLRVRGRILEEFYLIPSTRNDAVSANNDHSHRHLLGLVGLGRLAQRFTHEHTVDFGIRDVRLGTGFHGQARRKGLLCSKVQVEPPSS